MFGFNTLPFGKIGQQAQYTKPGFQQPVQPPTRLIGGLAYQASQQQPQQMQQQPQVGGGVWGSWLSNFVNPQYTQPGNPQPIQQPTGFGGLQPMQQPMPSPMMPPVQQPMMQNAPQVQQPHQMRWGNQNYNYRQF